MNISEESHIKISIINTILLYIEEKNYCKCAILNMGLHNLLQTCREFSEFLPMNIIMMDCCVNKEKNTYVTSSITMVDAAYAQTHLGNYDYDENEVYYRSFIYIFAWYNKICTKIYNKNVDMLMNPWYVFENGAWHIEGKYTTSKTPEREESEKIHADFTILQHRIILANSVDNKTKIDRCNKASKYSYQGRIPTGISSKGGTDCSKPKKYKKFNQPKNVQFEKNNKLIKFNKCSTRYHQYHR